jgi:hypothetical protein
MTKKTELSNWYMKGQFVPELGTVQFTKFAAHGFSFITEILGNRRVGYRIDEKSPTAYYDGDHGTIALPGWYFLPESIRRVTSEESKGALTLINGSTIHEALHSKHTTMNPEQIYHAVRGILGSEISEQITATVASIVEDIAIENSRQLKAYQKAWIAAKNDILFNDKLFAEVVAQYNPTVRIMVAQMLVNYKRVALQEIVGKLVGASIAEVLEEVKRKNTFMTNANKIDAVAKIVIMIDEKVASEIEKSRKEEEEKAKSEESEEESEPESDPFEPDGEPVPSKGPEEPESEKFDPKADTGEGAMGEVAEEIADDVKEKFDEVEKTAEEFGKAVEKANEKLEKTARLDKATASVEFLYKQLKISDIAKETTLSGELLKIEFSNRFVSLLKQMRTVLPTRGRGKLTGGKLDVMRLHQVAIDNKIFSQKSIEQAGNNDKVEIILLVDASGSMHREMGYVELFKKCISVTYKIYLALRNANVQTKVFAHTSYGDNYPLLVKIVDNDTRNSEKKFQQALTLRLNENLDGIVIDEITKNQFTSDARTQKILLVLSDGSPQSPNYSYGIGVPHTQGVVENARKNGIKIFSISLVAEVVKGNDLLYGTDFNIDASKNLDKKMVELVTKLVRRK